MKLENKDFWGEESLVTAWKKAPRCSPSDESKQESGVRITTTLAFFQKKAPTWTQK